MIPFFLFIFGLMVGSFLNAVIYRLNSGEGIILPRSKCPHCQQQLKFLDLLPLLSFIFLKGKCRYCQVKISWQYPLVELFTAIIFVCGYFVYKVPLGIFLATFDFGGLLPYLSFLVFSCFLIIIFVYDLKHYLILDRISLPAFAIALFLNLLNGEAFSNLIIASLLVAGFFLLQFLISKGKWIGGGDIRLGLVIGAMLGWPRVLMALFLGYLIGSVVGLFLIITKKKQWQSQLPLGTFLALAALITLLWGNQIIFWYLNRFILW